MYPNTLYITIMVVILTAFSIHVSLLSSKNHSGDDTAKDLCTTVTAAAYRSYACDWLNIILYVEIKCQLEATEVFIADLIACSTCFGHHYAHHQELKSIIQWLLPVIFRAVVFQVAGLVWSWGLCVRFAGCWFKPQHEIPQAATTV